MTLTTMVVVGLVGWVLVIVGSFVVARLVRARDVVRVVVWSFVAFNVVYLTVAVLTAPKPLARVTAERIQGQAERTGRSLDRLQREVDSVKVAFNADPARFAGVESLVAEARAALGRTGAVQEGRGAAADELRRANDLAAQARRRFRQALQQAGVVR